MNSGLVLALVIIMILVIILWSMYVLLKLNQDLKERLYEAQKKDISDRIDAEPIDSLIDEANKSFKPRE